MTDLLILTLTDRNDNVNREIIVGNGSVCLRGRVIPTEQGIILTSRKTVAGMGGPEYHTTFLTRDEAMTLMHNLLTAITIDMQNEATRKKAR